VAVVMANWCSLAFGGAGARRWIGAAVTALLVLAEPAGARAETPPDIVVTIKPIHSLAASVMAGVGSPRLLIDGAGSPHTYAMKPSDAKALNSARLVIRVAPSLETFLNNTLKSLPKSARVLTLEGVPGLVLHPVRTGGNFEDDGHGHGHGHGDGHGKKAAKGAKAPVDGHLWLDPRNASRMATAIAEALAEIDSTRADRYRANAAALNASLTALDRELEAAAKPLAGRSFIVFHDAYQYAEARYGLAASGSITVSPEVQPSAKRLQALRRTIGRLGATCVFAEPQFPPKLLDTVVEGTKARRGTLDPLGAAIPAGPDHYPALMRALMRDLSACLGSG